MVDTPLSSIPSGLRREGGAMLSALVEDTLAVAEVVTPVDARLAPDLGENDALTKIGVDSGQLWAHWIDAAKGCDAAMIVAPENDGILAQGVAMLRAGGIDVIAGSGDFLRVASDKVMTAKVLHSAGINHPLYMATGDRRQQPRLRKADRFVVKPRDGCGTQQICQFESFDEAVASLTEKDILQEWRLGRSISVGLIASGGKQVFLPSVSQIFQASDHSYSGGQGPLCDDDQRRAMALAGRAVEAMPPTARGFIGLDLLLGQRPSEDCVIEINPRLTTSYVGLRKMTGCNLAAHILGLSDAPILCDVGVNEVTWTAEGETNDEVTSRDNASTSAGT
ncbi:MAG: ATP-grasp domain-containing protein [Planctomycetota bacterium]